MARYLVGFVFSATLAAQSPQATISGVVTDAQGARIVGRR